MALVGNIVVYNSVLSENETQTIEVTYPDNLDENDPKYDLRGMTVNEEVPLINTTETLHENVYVHIHSVNFWKQYMETGKKDLVNINYRVYASKSDRDENPDSFIIEDHLIGKELDFSVDKNQMEKSYDYVRSIMGFEQLTND